jgi:hypothetical protein
VEQRKKEWRMTKVLVVSDQSIFGRGLEDLLREQEGIDLITDQVTDVGALPECLERCRPDVVFFGCSDPGNCPTPLFVQSLRGGLVRKIICVNLEDSAVYVFHGERHAVEDVQDLLEAIGTPGPGTFSDMVGCLASSPSQGKEGKAPALDTTDQADATLG